MTAASASLLPGELVAGKFRIERVIGRGGMGLVVEATNAQLDQRVALKFLAAGIGDAETVSRFVSEARSAAKLRSEHVARVYDVGTDTRRGPFIVMELLVGSNLADIVAKGGRLPIQRAAEYIIDACEGLAEAHARGLVHQDVKPANLFVTTGNDGKPTVKVLDFGIARVTGAPAASGGKATSHGSPHYLSPEQLRASANVDRRADVWGLGCVLHELVTGAKPFQADRFVELVANILEGKRARAPDGIDLPPALVEIIARCLELDPARRYKSSGELAIALLPLARRRAHAVASIAVARVRESGIDPTLQMPASMPPPPDRESSDPVFDLRSSGRVPRAAPVPELDFGTAPTLLPPHDLRTSDAPSTATAPPAEQRRPTRTVAIIAAALLVILAIGGGAALVSRSPEPAAAAPPPPSALAAPLPLPVPSAAPLPAASASAVDVVASARPTPAVTHAPVGVAPKPAQGMPKPGNTVHAGATTPPSTTAGSAHAPAKLDIERAR